MSFSLHWILAGCSEICLFVTCNVSENDSLNLLCLISVFLTHGMNQTTDLEDLNNPSQAQAVAPSGISSGIHHREPADKNSHTQIIHKFHTQVWKQFARGQLMTDESDIKIEYILIPVSPYTSREIRSVVFIGTVRQRYRHTEQWEDSLAEHKTLTVLWVYQKRTVNVQEMRHWDKYPFLNLSKLILAL